MNTLEALELAIDREKGAHRYYSEAAAKSTSAESRKIFSWLASEEMGHLRILERQSGEIRKTGKWLRGKKWLSCNDLSNPVDCSEFPSRPEVQKQPESDKPELEILKDAIAAEKKAAAFYADLARETTDRDGKVMLEKLASIEQGHLDLLEEEFEWLKRAKEMFTIHRFALRS